MTANVTITSGPKGSNPGGECIVRTYDTNSLRGYFKYCHASKLPRDSCLSVKHQPFYEAITVKLAKQIGLKTTDAYILLNPNKDVVFEGWRENGLHCDPAGRDCYFVSRLVSRGPLDSTQDLQEISKVLETERVHLESILVDDIINKRQNYLFYWGDGKGQIKYIDLGCSFVRAIGGAISLPQSLKQLEPKEMRRIAKNLSNVDIISADDSQVVNLAVVARGVFDMRIPTLNPSGCIALKDRLSQRELDEIFGYVLHGLSDAVSKFKERGLLLN